MYVVHNIHVPWKISAKLELVIVMVMVFVCVCLCVCVCVCVRACVCVCVPYILWSEGLYSVPDDVVANLAVGQKLSEKLHKLLQMAMQLLQQVC